MSGEQELSELVSRRLNVKWSEFSQRHPNLAAAIEPVKLVETTVRRLIEDPEYQRAMEQAAIDQAALAAGEQVMKLIDRWIERGLGLL